MKEQGARKMASAAAVSRTYLSYTKPHVWSVAVIFLAGVAIQAANLIAPLYLKQMFNLLAVGDKTPVVAQALIGLLAVVGVAWLLERIFRRIQDIFTVTVQSRVMAQLFDASFEYLMGHSYNFFISNFTGSLTHRVSKFARAYEVLFDTIMISFVPTAIFVVGAVGVLYARSHVLGIALGIWCIAFVWFQMYVARLRQPARNARSEADTKITATLADTMTNQSTVMLFSGARFEWVRFSAVVEHWRKATLRNWMIDGWFWGAVSLFILAIQIGLYYAAIRLWEQSVLTIGDFVLIQAYLMTVFERLVSINRELRRFHDVYADASEMVYLLELPHEVKDVAGALALVPKGGEIEFSDISFKFKEGQGAILDEFNLHIASGQRVALVGPSGAGKSTITRLLLRMYDVKRGNIRIDGQDIARVTQASLRDAIAYVPQEPVLFHRTLMENIRYGKRDATDEEVIEAAKKAHCHEFISVLPDQYNTFVGERGVRLSGGERQRVAIARAILKDAPILLLDEATSSLDSESEMLIQDALELLMRKKTVIVIAHRLSTIMKMDRIIVLEHGHVVADGTHDELLKGGGLYHKLWSIQAGGFIVDTAEEEEEIEVETDEDEEKEPLPEVPMK